jgi:hypothetical protein
LTNDHLLTVERRNWSAVQGVAKREGVTNPATERVVIRPSQQSVSRQTVRRMLRHAEIVSHTPS